MSFPLSLSLDLSPSLSLSLCLLCFFFASPVGGSKRVYQHARIKISCKCKQKNQYKAYHFYHLNHGLLLKNLFSLKHYFGPTPKIKKQPELSPGSSLQPKTFTLVKALQKSPLDPIYHAVSEPSHSIEVELSLHQSFVSVQDPVFAGLSHKVQKSFWNLETWHF